MARGSKSISKGAVVGGTVVGGNGTVSGPATVYTAVQNATDLAGAVNTAVQKKIESRPKGTSSSYDPKQKKWATYVSGVLDLYKQQVSLGTNLHTNPRGGALTSYMDSLGREEATRKRDAMDDRQGGTIQDGYSHHIFSRINNHYLAMTTIITAQGKTNQFGRLEYAGCFRYKNVLECPQGLVPDLSLKHQDLGREVPVTYRMQYDNMCKVLDALHIQSSKKTHLNRGGGARRAEDNGASEAQIRRAGRWSVEKMQGCYLTGLPRESMRAMAGFSIHPGGFFLPRGTTTPSKSLQQQIFSGVGDILLQVETGKLERDLAAQGFLKLLQYLRVVLIQDAVVLRQSQPH
ncbi:unnamed protein product, partial [Tilletia controversa]